MNTVIVCGHSSSSVNQAFARLQQAGIMESKPASLSVIPTIEAWHQSLFTQQLDLKPGLVPGKAWQQAAGEIFLSNWEVPLWGWADTRSIWLLDFWREFDPQTRFVLLYSSPTEFLLQALLALPVDAEIDFEQLLLEWLAYSVEMQRFQVRNRNRCIMIDSASAAKQPAWLVQSVKEALNVALERIHVEAIDSNILASNPLGLTLVSNVLLNYPEVTARAAEIEASLITLDEILEDPSFESVIQQFRHLVTQDKQLPILSKQLAEQSLQASQYHAQVEQLSSVQEEQTKQIHTQTRLAQEQQAQLEKLTLTHQQQLKSAEENRERLQQESELLLLQLHQVQEELEQIFIDNQQLQQALAQSVAAQQALEQEWQQAIHKVNADYLPQIDRLNQKLSQLSEKENQLKKENADLSNKLEQSKHLTQQKQQQLDVSGENLRRLQQESELLLLQLHQVQEELEHYFLQYQAEQNQNSVLQQRWQRLIMRFPDFAEWDSIKILGVETLGAANNLAWRIENLTVGARHLGSFNITVTVNNKGPALIINRAEGVPLLRWPSIFKEKQALILQPGATDQLAQDDWEALRHLTASDWHLIKALCGVLLDSLNSPETYRPLSLDVDYWSRQLALLIERFSNLPSFWRFDSIELKHEQVNPDYEHLWFVVNNAQYAAHRWPVFEFRLSAANVTHTGQQLFSFFPKLEFPAFDGDAKQFEHWFEESCDDFGPKFELRFALQSGEMDMEAWNRLSATDNKQLLALTLELPYFIAECEAQKASISRSWSDWQALATGIYQILRARTV